MDDEKRHSMRKLMTLVVLAAALAGLREGSGA